MAEERQEREERELTTARLRAGRNEANEKTHRASLESLAPSYHIEHVEIGDGVILCGADKEQPFWVAEVVELQPKLNLEVKEDRELLEAEYVLGIIWCQAEKAFGVYRQEVIDVDEWKKAHKRNSKPPLVLPKKWQSRQNINRWLCYCRFPMPSNRQIPEEIKVWILEHTDLIKQWDGVASPQVP